MPKPPLTSPDRRAAPAPEVSPADGGQSVLIVRVVAVHDDATVDVEVEPGGAITGVLRAIATVAVGPDQVGRRGVVTMAANGGPSGQPSRDGETLRGTAILLGLVQEPLSEILEARVDAPSAREVPFDLEVDEERVVLEASREVVLRCGESSITLKKDGRVLIRGSHVVSRSTGPNKVKGASIQLN